MKNFRLALIILLVMSAMNAARAGALTEEVKQRVQADLNGKCLKLFLEEKLPFTGYGYQNFASGFVVGSVVFVAGGNDLQYCWWQMKGVFKTWEDVEKRTIAGCEKVRPASESPCEVYAHNNDIVYVSIHEKLKTAKKLIEAGDVPAAERALNEVKDKKLSKLSADETGEYEYLFGRVLVNAKIEQDRAFAIGHFNDSWSKYKNVNGAVEEGNLRTAAGDLDKNWQPIRSAYQYFLANASDEQKSLHPEVEQNLKQTEPYYQADLAQKEEAAKERARLGAIEEEREAERKAEQLAIYKKEQPQREKQAKREAEQQAKQDRLATIQAKREAEQQAKQERLDAAKAEREAQQQEKIRQAEAKHIAKEGDGSADDLTCKSYGAQPGTQGYINCRIQLSSTRQLVGEQQAAQNAQQATQAKAANEQQAAQARAASEQRAAQADYQNRLAAAQYEAQARRDAEDQNRRESAALMAIGGALMRNSTPQQAPALRAPIRCSTMGNMGVVECQ